MATPSLLLIPDRYKASKLYSQIPDSGAGDLAFTRANDTATRVNSAGLIEKVRTNRNIFSQDFTNAAYVTAGYGNLATIVANSTANPLNGVQDADTATFVAAGDQGRLLQLFTSLGINSPFTYSMYVKAGTKTSVSLSADVLTIGIAAAFNLTAGTIVSTTNCTAAIQNAGSGFYRCSITFSLIGAANAQCGIVTQPGEDGSLILFGAQLEAGDIATPYIPTTTAAVSVGPVANIPRIDYTGGGCGKLLLEPQRTNLALFSEQLNNAAWTKNAVSISANTTTAPDGTNSADKVIEDTATAVHRVIQSFTGTGLAVSFYAKSSERTKVALLSPSVDIGYDLTNGTLIDLGYGTSNAEITNVGNGWYRCSKINNDLNPSFGIALLNASNAINYTGNGTSGLFLWGAQVEAGSYVSSYIPTLGASVTRSADTAQKGAFGNTSTSGTLYYEFEATRINSDNGMYLIGLGVGTTDTLGSSYATAAGALSIIANGPQLQGKNNGYADNLFTISPAVGSTQKIAIRYDGTNIVAFINGVKQTVVTDNAVGVKNFIRVNNGEQTSHAAKTIAFYPTALSDSEAIQLTTL